MLHSPGFDFKPLILLSLAACSAPAATQPGADSPKLATNAPAQAAAELPPSAPPASTVLVPVTEPPPTPACSPADWSARKLAPLLATGKPRGVSSAAHPDQLGSEQLLFVAECTDAPNGPRSGSAEPVTTNGVEIHLVERVPGGKSGRGWSGDRCSFDVKLADGSGKPTHLGAAQVPPLTTITAIARAGSAVYLSIGFNGYTKEFPQGGNRVVALDACDGRVAWQSRDGISNGGLLLLGDYVLAPYGFTSEKRYIHVLDAHTGALVQKLPVVENICPSKSWAPNHRPGDRCDAPGQLVGAARGPRVEGGLFLVDTNTGSAAFGFL